MYVGIAITSLNISRQAFWLNEVDLPATATVQQQEQQQPTLTVSTSPLLLCNFKTLIQLLTWYVRSIELARIGWKCE